MVFRILLFILGCGFILTAISSALGTFVVPRGTKSNILTRTVFVLMRYVFLVPLYRASHSRREQALAYFAPVSLITLPIFWLGFILIGYTAIYWALGASSWSDALNISRLSLLYIGSDNGGIPGGTGFAFSETVFSLLLAAILVSYLPTMYGAFSQREQAVTGLQALAGSPPSALKMLKRFHLITGMDEVEDVWNTWQVWFATVEETHTALQPLVFYRSPQPDRSWITAAGAVLDTASIVASTLDRPRDPQAELCIRAGYLCLQRIAVPFQIPFNADPAPSDPISVSREEYDELYDALDKIGVPLKPDRDAAWRDFAGWRVNYDAVLVGLAVMVTAPPGVWSSDRVPRHRSVFVTARRSGQRAAAAAIAGRSLT